MREAVEGEAERHWRDLLRGRQCRVALRTIFLAAPSLLFLLLFRFVHVSIGVPDVSAVGFFIFGLLC